MIKKRIILILLIIGIILTISTVNATEDIQDPYNQTVINMNENIEVLINKKKYHRSDTLMIIP